MLTDGDVVCSLMVVLQCVLTDGDVVCSLMVVLSMCAH